MLTKDELVFLSAQLAQLKACKGAKQCTVGAQNLPAHGSSTNPSITGVDNLALDSSNLQTNHNKKRKYWGYSNVRIAHMSQFTL